MGIPANNSEDLQLLRYEKGQFYRTHHDYIPHQVDRQCGPRILTFFLYLSDVEAGGGTNFPNLGITVMPKRGRALLWPSVLNSNPLKKDGRFMHQALDVEDGVKYAANAWIHLYDYVAPQKIGCN
jgi:prolyl 4-hydroxylase